MNFTAPWGRSVKLITITVVTGLLALVAIGLAMADYGTAWLVAMVALPLVILLGTAPFMVRGYRLEGDQLRVRRLGWTSAVSLAGLQSAAIDGEAMKSSLRVFGDGGVFGFVGYFRGSRLGPYRAWVTDRSRAVVLRFPDRVVVVSPGDPETFVARLQETLQR